MQGMLYVLFIKLKCGMHVSVSNFYYNRTYSGLIAGIPNEEINNRIVDKAMNRMDSIWGIRKTHLIPPTITMKPVRSSGSTYPSLPSTELTAWITCLMPINDEHMASELVLVWYVDDKAFEASSIRDVTSDALNMINWSEVAEGYDL